MAPAAEALVIGGGPAGAATAIFLARAGWQVLLVEQSEYPRQKVCGECIAAAGLEVLDELGVGAAVRDAAGPELRRVGWMDRGPTLSAEFPPCRGGRYAYGRAIGRDRLDELLIGHARALGVEVLQPAKVRSIEGGAGEFEVIVDLPGPRARRGYAARIVIDAHGSWEPAPRGLSGTAGPQTRARARWSRKPEDLFAFKASFAGSHLAPGLLPVISLDGGYGGMVVAEQGRTTLACCIRRDRLKAWRDRRPGTAAGAAIGELLGHGCADLGTLLGDARQIGPWLTVGPIRPGIRVDSSTEIFRVGNAAGESHPLVGEGIAMALQSARLLAVHLAPVRGAALEPPTVRELNRRYAQAWRAAFAVRLRVAAAAARAAMNPTLSGLSRALIVRRPKLLTHAARWAGKAQPAIVGA